MTTTIPPQYGQLMRSSVRTTDRTKANLFYIPYFPKFDVSSVLKHCTTNASLIEEAKTVMKYRTAVVRKWLWSQPQCVSPPPFVNSDSVPLCSILFHSVILTSLTVYVSPPPFETNDVIVNIAFFAAPTRFSSGNVLMYRILPTGNVSHTTNRELSTRFVSRIALSLLQLHVRACT
jgi:hypothetical protein